MDHIHDFLVVGIHSILGVKCKEGQAFLRFVAELLFYGEGNVNRILLVKLVIAHEPIHSGPQHKGLSCCTADDMEEGILILRATLVLFL